MNSVLASFLRIFQMKGSPGKGRGFVLRLRESTAKRFFNTSIYTDTRISQQYFFPSTRGIKREEQDYIEGAQE